MNKLYSIVKKSLFKGCLTASLLFVGCFQEDDHDESAASRHNEPGVHINDRRVSISELKLDDPVLYVNGEKITKRDFEALLVLRDRLWRLHQNEPFIVSKEEMDEFRFQAGDSMMIELIHRALFRQYAKVNKIEPSKNKIEEATKLLLKSIRKPNSNMADIAEAIGGDAAKLFLEIPYIDAQDAMSRQSVTTNDLDNVSESEIKRRIEFVKRFDANAEEMNRRARARLMEAKQRILAGGDIAEEARKIFDTVHPEYAEKWGRFEIQEFPADEDLHKWLLKSKPGDISDPLDTEDGIAIVKVIERGRGEAPEGVVPPDAFTLVRCTVKACEKMRYQNPDEMRQQLLLWKRQEAQKKLGMMLTEKAVIEYPNGTNLFSRISKEVR